MTLKVPQIVKDLREEENSKNINLRKINNNKKTSLKEDIETKLKNIIIHSDDIYYIHDYNHKLIYVSPQSKKIFGYTPEEMMVKWTTLITDNPINEIGLNLTKKCIETGEKQKPYILEALKNNGEKIIVRINESPIKNEYGEVIQVTGVLKDITKEYKQNEQLKTITQVIKQSRTSVAILDLEGKVEYANPKLLGVYGSKLEEIIGKHWSKWLSEYSTLKDNLQEIRDKVLNKGRFWTGEICDKDKNGNIIWREATIFPIKDTNGNIIKTVYTSIDITDKKNSEKELGLSNKLFKDLFNTIIDPVVIVDSKGKFLEITDKVEEITGFRKDELIGKNFLKSKIVTNKTKALLIKNLIKRMSGLKIPPYEIEVLTKDGRKLPFEVNASKINYKDQSADMVIFRDITQRKKTELELIKNEEKFRTFFENEPDYCYIVNTDGIILDINHSALKILGYKKEELLGKSLLNTIYTGASQKKAKVLINKWKKTGTLTNEEISITSKNGDTKDVLLSVNSVKDVEGKIIHSISIQRDITEIKKSKKILQESEENYKRLFDASPYGIITLNKKGFVTTCNSAFLSLSGYVIDEIVGKHISRLPTIQLKSLPTYLKIIKNFIKGDISENIQFEWKHKDGSIRLGEAVIKELKNRDGKHFGLLAIVRDITEIKKVEKEKEEAHEQLKILNEKLEAKVKDRTLEIEKLLNNKDEFINQLGHDLKNPLTPLVNLLPIIENTEKNPETKKMLKVVNRNVNYMKNLVVKTIDLARLNSPNTEFKFEKINLLSEMNNVIETNKLLFEEKNIQVANNVPGDIHVSADKLRIDELLNNLLNNSVKYTDGKGTIIIDAKIEENFVTISISDAGIGMTNEQLSHVFDEFYKADESRHDFDSSGLGMPICKRIVERHGGRIWAESDGVGKGCTFYFTLPKK